MRVTSVVLLAWLAGAQWVAAEEPRAGLPWDWSHRHVIYNPETAEEAIANGRYDEWLQKSADPRFVSQLLRKMDARMDQQAAIDSAATGVAKSLLKEPTANGKGPALPPAAKPGKQGGKLVHRDWSNVLGGVSGVGFKGAYPAKYSFDINATPSCTSDFLVYVTASSGVLDPGGGALASRNGTMTAANAGVGNTVTITNGTQVLTITASSSSNTGLNFLAPNGATAATKATNLAAAINRNGGTVGVTATAAAAVVTVKAITKGTGANSIALAEGLGGFSWAGTTLSGGSGTAAQPTIVAFNQLYSSCNNVAGSTQPVPATYWSYSTGAAAFAELSPVISLDGTQVAFIERTGTAASLVLLKWSSSAPGTIGVPTTPATAASAAAYKTCTAPCMFKMALGANDTRSAPYYDYTGDTLFVGSDDGKLHKFTGVFTGTVAESGAPWPVTVAAGFLLSPPVYDQSTGYVYVGSNRDAGTVGGRLHSVSPAGVLDSSVQIGGDPEAGQPAGSTGVADAPILDSFAQRIYAFVGSDSSTNCGGVQCQGVYQFKSNPATNGALSTQAPAVAQVGRGQFYDRILFAGAFDNAYWLSTPASPTGALYVCGSLADGTSSRRPTLWRIPITNNVMGAPVVGPQIVSNTDTLECSPITEVANGTHDYLYVSVPANGNDTGCAGSCVYVYDLSTAGAWGTGVAAAAGLAAAGGTGGIIIDNISSSTGASQVYYSTLTSPGVAVQASQAGLN